MLKQTLNLHGEHVIIIETDGKGGGSMTAIGLREACHYCGSVDCERSCDESQAGGIDSDHEAEEKARLLFNAAVNGVESFLLALACEGIRVDGAEYHRALQTVMDKLGQRYE